MIKAATLQLLPADIIFTPGMWAVRLLQTAPGESRTYAGHTAGMTDENTVTEALWRVTSTPFAEWDAKHPDYEIFRPLWLSYRQKQAVAEVVLANLDRLYAPLKLGAHATDWLIAWARYIFTLGQWKGEVYAARWVLEKFGIEGLNICSMLWGKGFEAVAYTKWGDPLGVNPDGQHDVCRSQPRDWALWVRKVKGEFTGGLALAAA